MVKKILFLCTCLLILVAACTDNVDPNINNQKSLNTSDKDWKEVPLKMADLEKIQEEVNQGHKVGLLDPVQVAREFLEYKLEIKGGKADLSDSAGEEKTVTINLEKDKSIELRLIQPMDKGRTGIWAVNAYRYSSLSALKPTSDNK